VVRGSQHGEEEMIEAGIIALAFAGGLIQGNWANTVGAVIWFIAMLCAAWFGPLDGVVTVELASLLVMLMGFVAAGSLKWNLGWETRWGNLRYSLIRYTTPLLLVSVAAALVAKGRPELVLFAFAGPWQSGIWLWLGQHKPQWVSNIVGNLDIARPVAYAGTAGILVHI